MKSLVVLGRSLHAWIAARDAARRGVAVRFLVPFGAADAMAPVFEPSFDWPAVYRLPRHVVVDGATLPLPLDPFEVMHGIGVRSWTLDAASLVRARLRRRAKATLNDVAVRDLGARMADRYACAWLAARYGTADAPAAVLDARPARGWIKLSDGEQQVRDEVWGAGGDVIEGIEVLDVERATIRGQPHVVAIETRHGLEHVDDDLLIDELDPNEQVVVESDGPDGVTEYARPAEGVWRQVRHDGTTFRFGRKSAKRQEIPALANVRRLGPPASPYPHLAPIDPYPG